MLKEILLSVIFIVVYFGSIILYMTRVYSPLEPRARHWLGERLGVKIVNSQRVRGAGWTIEGKHTIQQSMVVFFGQSVFVIVGIILPMIGLLGVLIASLAILNGGL